MKNFKEWMSIKEHETTVGKFLLYPPLYTQSDNYGFASLPNWSADAITYMTKKQLKFKSNDSYLKKAGL